MSAILAAVLAAVGGAAQPAQLIVSIAAACAFLALLTERGRVAPSDWFTVRVLLAANLLVLGIGNAGRLGVPVAVPVVASGGLLLVLAVRVYVVQRGRRGHR